MWSALDLKTDHRRPFDRIAYKGIAGVFQSKAKRRELLRPAHGLGDVTANVDGHPSFREGSPESGDIPHARIVQGSLGRTEHVNFQVHAMLVLYLPDALRHVPRELLSA